MVASGIWWSEKNADAFWFRARHRPNTRSSLPWSEHFNSSRVNVSALRSRSGDGAVADSRLTSEFRNASWNTARTLERKIPVHAYFNNTQAGAAVRYGLRLGEMLSE